MGADVALSHALDDAGRLLAEAELLPRAVETRVRADGAALLAGLLHGPAVGLDLVDGAATIP